MSLLLYRSRERGTRLRILRRARCVVAVASPRSGVRSTQAKSPSTCIEVLERRRTGATRESSKGRETAGWNKESTARYRLCQAIVEGQYERVRTLLAAGAPAHFLDRRGHTPLMLASSPAVCHLAGYRPLGSELIAFERFERRVAGLARRLTRRYIFWRLRQRLGQSSGDLEIVRLLLRRGARVDAADFRDRTALMYAAHWGDPVIVEELLAAGADPLRLNFSGRCALMYAAVSGSEEVADLLLEAGAELNLVDHAYKTALDLRRLGRAAGVQNPKSPRETGRHSRSREQDSQEALEVVPFAGNHERVARIAVRPHRGASN